MKKVMNGLMMAGLATVLVAPALGAGAGVAGRQVKQQKRIAQGVRSGSLTPGETARLQRNSARIHGSVVRDRRDQGVFTPRERTLAQKRLNRQSRAIATQKRDEQQR